jgi:hypothetical protein
MEGDGRVRGVAASAREHGRMPSLLSPETAAAEPLEITCPRCGTATHERFYGPCGSCRAALRSELGSEARAVEAAAYEPKMNVTPNAVALKD